MHDFTLAQSLAHRDTLLAQPLDSDTLQRFIHSVQASFEEQKALEDSDTESFDDYVARFLGALVAKDASKAM